MPNAQGFKARMLVGEEASYGTPGSNAWKMPMIRPGLRAAQNKHVSRALLDDANPRRPTLGNRSVDGTTEMECSPASIGWWLKWLIGGVATQAAGTGSGYLINNGAGYPVGTTVLTLDTGTGTLPAGSWVTIGGKYYRVDSSTGAPVTSLTIAGGLLDAVADNAAVTVPAGTSGHTFDLGSTAPTSITCEVGFTDAARYHQYKGVYVDRMGFNFASEGLMSASIDLAGKDFTPFGATQFGGTVTTPTHQPFGYFGAAIIQGTSVLAVAKSMDFTISRERDKNQFVIDGTGTRNSIPSGIARIEGTIKVLYADDTLISLASAGTETTIRATVRDANSVGAMDFYFPEVQLTLSSPDVVSEAVVELDIPFMAYYENGSLATSVRASLMNSTSSYASM